MLHEYIEAWLYLVPRCVPAKFQACDDFHVMSESDTIQHYHSYCHRYIQILIRGTVLHLIKEHLWEVRLLSFNKAVYVSAAVLLLHNTFWQSHPFCKLGPVCFCDWSWGGG